jgi:hypothetical protein
MIKKYHNHFSKYDVLSKECPYLIEFWDYDKNLLLSPNEITPGTNIKIYWHCKKCNCRWEENIFRVWWRYKHNYRICKNCHSLAVMCPELAKLWHPTKNGKLTPYDVSYRSHKKTWWISNNGYAWKMNIHNLCSETKSGKNYADYRGNRVWESNSLFTMRPDLIREWDWEENKNIDPRNITCDSGILAKWKCEKCGNKWAASVNSRNRGKGVCFRCLTLALKNPKLASEWHPTKNGKITPYDVRCYSKNKKYYWICKNGHVYMSTVQNRTYGSSCPLCYGVVLKDGTHCDSIIEAYFYLLYKSLKTNFKFHGFYGGILGRRRYDFYLIDENKYVEVTSFDPSTFKYWPEYIKNIRKKKKYVTKILGAEFEFIRFVPNKQQIKYVKEHSERKPIVNSKRRRIDSEIWYSLEK